MKRDFFPFALPFCCALALTVAQAQTSPEIPLCPGLTIVTAIHQQYGDYESIKTIETVDAKQVRLKYSSESMQMDMLVSTEPKLKQTILHRTILSGDLDSANAYQQVYLEKSEETIPGTTAIGTSRAVLRALKSGGEVDLKISNAYSSLELTADSNKR